MKQLKDYLPPMYSGKELYDKLAVYPEYDSTICSTSVPERLTALSDICSLYIPTDSTIQVYYKLYLALIRSLSQKNTPTATRQLYENHKAIRGQSYKGILGGLDSFVITGNSGVGKSSAVGRAISVISSQNVIEIKKPYQKILPFLVVQTPFDCSIKSLLLEILRKVDEAFDTRYHYDALRIHATTDHLIGTVSTLCLNHIGVLVCDEAQNVIRSKNGRSLVSSITQLINSAGISIVFVGTESVIPFLESDFMLARRTMNIRFEPLQYDEKFYGVCKTILQYQYVKQPCELTDEIVSWLYNHSKGNISVVISLIYEAQLYALTSGLEALNVEALNSAYGEQLSLLHGYLSPQNRYYAAPHKESFSLLMGEEFSEQNEHLIAEIVNRAKIIKANPLEALREYITIEEMTV